MVFIKIILIDAQGDEIISRKTKALVKLGINDYDKKEILENPSKNTRVYFYS